MKRTKHIINNLKNPLTVPLTPEQQSFINEYVEDQDPIQALKRANIFKSLSKAQAEEISQEYLNSVNVQTALHKALQDKVKRLQTTENAVIAQISRMAFTDAKDLYDENGNIKPVKDLPYELRCGIRSLEVVSKYKRNKITGERVAVGYTTKVTINNQLDALKTILEKVIQKPLPTVVNQFNTITQNNQMNNTFVDTKKLTPDQVKMLLELKGLVDTPLGYQPPERALN